MPSAVVTGGASGIGRAVAELLRDDGHDVVAWDLSGRDIDCDVSDPDAQVIHAYGGLALDGPIDAFGHGQRLARKR